EGAIGAPLRREGLRSSHLTSWRRLRERGELAGLTPKRRGPKPALPDRFGSLPDARPHVAPRMHWYNEEHYHSGIALLTPSDVHHGRAPAIVEARQRTLDTAYAADPERFVHGAPTHQLPPTEVWINRPGQATGALRQSHPQAVSESLTRTVQQPVARLDGLPSGLAGLIALSSNSVDTLAFESRTCCDLARPSLPSSPARARSLWQVHGMAEPLRAPRRANLQYRRIVT
ncbi:MAG: hypothetical protein R3B06_27745, partial [Kofleriaceae bacterium]